ncbi:MAG: hypothetical protein ABGW97_16770 [Christiangramia sp.]|uniref:hypothetical protein n=1 Tax=Christiangramia sp. TaxID=1931228 RepID=UPI00324249D2
MSVNRREIIDETYLTFCEAEGNQHIASRYAIQKIIELLRRFKPDSVLEVGLGIGSISGTILRVFDDKNLKLYGTENNQFCLEALKNNLGEDYKSLNIYSDLKAIKGNVKFDLVIVDGGDTNLEIIKNKISDNGIIIIEGDRKNQLKLLKEYFPDHLYVHSISKRKNLEMAPFPSKNWEGGVKLIFINPNFKQKIYWLREKFQTKMRYSYRALRA